VAGVAGLVVGQDVHADLSRFAAYQAQLAEIQLFALVGVEAGGQFAAGVIGRHGGPEHRADLLEPAERRYAIADGVLVSAVEQRDLCGCHSRYPTLGRRRTAVPGYKKSPNPEGPSRYALTHTNQAAGLRAAPG